MNDYDRMRQRHHDGMCGGACPECYEQRAEEDYRRQQQEPTTEEMCDPHPYHSDDSDGGRCYCGQKRYAIGGGDL